LFVFLALPFAPVHSQHRAKFTDDVLVTIPQTKMEQVEFLIPAAIHLYQLTTQKKTLMRKMLLMK
jgi:hypothetical protein